MAFYKHQLHFVLIPLMALGHFIPMIDMAKLLAQHGVNVTVVTTPIIASRFNPIINRAIESGLPLRLLPLRFPSVVAGLPEGCETVDNVRSVVLMKNFYDAIDMLQEPFEQLIEELKPCPCCIIAEPDRIEVTKALLRMLFNVGSSVQQKFMERARAAEVGAYGVVINSFEELEPRYVDEIRKAKGDKVWCIGPLSLCNKDNLDKAQRGNKAAIDENQCLMWLDEQESGSVVYVCLGSLGRLTPPQLIELALGLEGTKRPFVWVIRGGGNEGEIEKWVEEDGFEERTKGRGLLIRGWAPQLLILSHWAVGAFLTHCGWNSTLEGVCAGVPLITWPMFAEQFLNEKLVVQILEIGVSVGVEKVGNIFGEDKCKKLVERETVEEVVEKVMDEGIEGEERRKRAKVLGEMAKRVIEEGGSSYLNMKLLIEDVMKQVNHKESMQEHSGS